jgi:hypothetical protein
MNPSEEVTEIAELHVPFGDYCFAYIDKAFTVQVSTRNTEPADLVSAFVSYMKAVGVSSEAIEEALYNQATVMKACRVLGAILNSKE